ncbi:MAG: hypothetical protein M1498_01940 [Candidatus Thermoplasmatota archaeon]|nr:hypothetical protein [Candidatus Thermoplasmatota archaeon]MCL5888581.1 hypothetical protein [Candidatus Thermoplasmatota archaeon]
MKDKLVIGVVSLLLGALILVSLLMPWWSESLGIFFGKFTFYPFSIPGIAPNNATDNVRYFSYISGVLSALSGVAAIVSGIWMIYKKIGENANISSVIASIIGILGMIFYVIFIYKISPDTGGSIFYYSTSVYSYGLQAGFYIEGISSIILFIVGVISLS